MAADTIVLTLKDDTGATVYDFPIPRHKLDAASSPGVTDDAGAGFAACSLWADTVRHRVFVCTDNTAGAAAWTQVAPAPNSGATAGSYGDATHVPQVTVDAAGRVTFVTTIPVAGVGFAVGDPVAGGSTHAVVFEDAASKVAASPALQFSGTAGGTTGLLTVTGGTAGAVKAQRTSGSMSVVLGGSTFALTATDSTGVYSATLCLNGGPSFSGADATNAVVFCDGTRALDATGDVRATSFTGDGSLLTALTASQLTTGTVAAARLPPYALNPGGRVTLQSSTPVPAADVTGATTIYYTPALHDQISLWDGSRWVTVSFVQVSLAPTLAASTVYDLYGYLSAGTLALEVSAWTNDTTRATGVSLQDGRWCKAGDKTRLLLGTLRTTGGGTLEDSDARRFCWNVYNRAERRLYLTDATATWTYNVAAWRPWNNSTGNRVQWVHGLAEDAAEVAFQERGYNTANANNGSYVGLGVNSTTAPAVNAFMSNIAAPYDQTVAAVYRHPPAVGLTYVQALEYGDTVGPPTFLGGGAGGGAGLWGRVRA